MGSRLFLRFVFTMSPLLLRYTSYRNFFYLWVRCQSCRKEKLVQILRVVVGVRAAQAIVGCVELGGIAFGLGHGVRI